ncbi:alpha/beta fold hydrolase [Pleurocapsales cyanobacterium LEGE 06147]|nr:alpha/beta fold hydrolase [Pleurocapsales cyanobacterium LEGE 06147]
MQTTKHWQQRIGNQRDWVWRGWQTRYTYLRATHSSRTPLILLHGFGTSIEHWRHNLPVLSQKHTVYALDLLGFGASRKANADYTVSLWVEQVHDFWQTFIRRPVVLVGNSIGSLVCLTLAATYPEMVEGIVMLSLPDVSLRQEMISPMLRSLVTSLENLVASPPLLKNLFKILRRRPFIRSWAAIAYENKAVITEELLEILSAPAYDEGAEQTFCTLFRAVRQPGFAPPAKEVLPKLNIPMLLIWGRQDRMVPPNLAPMFAQLNPNIKLVEIEPAGHCPHDECPEQFNLILLDWLEENNRADKQAEARSTSDIPSQERNCI